MKINKVVYTVLILLFVFHFQSNCHADGTIRFEDIDSIIKQKESLYLLINTTFHTIEDCQSSRLGNHFKFIGGMRIGPYLCKARTKASGKELVFKIIFKTDLRLLDKNKAILKSMIVNARFKEEEFLGVELKEITE